MTRVRLSGWEEPVISAARWLREHKNIPEYEIIEDAFAEYFNCSIIRVYDPEYTDSIYQVYAEFDEEEAALFILRWS